MTPGPSRRSGGFTLLELLVVVVITGVLLGGLIVPLSERLTLQQIRDEDDSLRVVREALLGYAQAYGRLPCPDLATDNDYDGTEDSCVNAGATVVSVGLLPFRTLGIQPLDRWGRRRVYAVTDDATVVVNTGQPAGNAGLDLDDRGIIEVVNRAGDKSERIVTSTAFAVVLSLGGNGFRGRDLDDTPLNDSPGPTPPGADEQENVDGDARFFSRVRTDPIDACSDDPADDDPLCEFDDQVAVLSTSLVLGRLVRAGRLP